MDRHTHTHTHTRDNYRNPRCTCAPRVNKVVNTNSGFGGAPQKQEYPPILSVPGYRFHSLHQKNVQRVSSLLSASCRSTSVVAMDILVTLTFVVKQDLCTLGMELINNKII